MDEDPEVAKRVGARIKSARDAKGLSQNALARLIDDENVSAGYISRWERGEHMPSWANLHKLAAALGVSIGWLVDNTPS